MFYLRLLHDHHTLKLGIYFTWSRVRPNSNVGVKLGTFLFVIDVAIIDAAKSLVEKIVEALMNVISLAHNDCVALYDRVTNSSYSVDLGRVKTNGGGIIRDEVMSVPSPQSSARAHNIVRVKNLLHTANFFY